jgi:hypothetical protein
MSVEVRTLVALALLAVVVSLGKALFHMTSSPDQSGQVVRALTFRIALSIALFVFLMLGWHFGLIEPNSMH